MDFIDGKMVSIYGQELAKRIIESRVKNLIKGKDKFDEIVNILTRCKGKQCKILEIRLI